MHPMSPKTADYIPSGRVIAYYVAHGHGEKFNYAKVWKFSEENMDLLFTASPYAVFHFVE